MKNLKKDSRFKYKRKRASPGLRCFLSSFFRVVVFSVLVPCGWWCLPPPSGGAVSMIGLWVVLGTNHCGKRGKRKTTRAKTEKKTNEQLVRNWTLCCGYLIFGARTGGTPTQNLKTNGKRKWRDWAENKKNNGSNV